MPKPKLESIRDGEVFVEHANGIPWLRLWAVASGDVKCFDLRSNTSALFPSSSEVIPTISTLTYAPVTYGNSTSS